MRYLGVCDLLDKAWNKSRAGGSNLVVGIVNSFIFPVPRYLLNLRNLFAEPLRFVRNVLC